MDQCQLDVVIQRTQATYHINAMKETRTTQYIYKLLWGYIDFHKTDRSLTEEKETQHKELQAV